MQHGEHGDGAADVTRIAGEFDDRGGARLHQRSVAVALIGPQHLTQLRWHGDGDVEVRHRQHLRLPVFEPLLCLRGVALGTTAVAAGNGKFPLPALWANLVMGSQQWLFIEFRLF